MSEFQAFPQAVYHPAQGMEVVQTKAELQIYLSQGWSMKPIEQTEQGMLEAKIKWHLEEASRLQGVLDGMTGKEVSSGNVHRARRNKSSV